jgi:hypothetical protein
MNRDTLDWFFKIPGLIGELQLLAWKHRTEAPCITAETVQSDIDGSGIRVYMIPRRAWEEDPRGLCDQIQQMFSSFSADEQCVFEMKILNGGKVAFSKFVVYSFNHTTVRGAEIVEALTAGTGAEDLADAFAWIESAYPAHVAQSMLQAIRTRAFLPAW